MISVLRQQVLYGKKLDKANQTKTQTTPIEDNDLGPCASKVMVST